MVTGVETAGLVLAAFPLVVAGLGHYVEGVRTIRYWRRFRRELVGFARDLENERIWYLDTLEGLLDRIVRSDEDLASLLAIPRGTLWQKPEYEERLRSRLDHSHDNYFHILTSLIQNLDEMRKKLGIDTEGTISWDNETMVEREMRRLKAVLSKNAYNELLDKIFRANRNLREMTQQSRYLEPKRRKRRSHRSIAELKLIRKQASSLYNVMVRGRCWKCQCRKHHVASLRLECRPRKFNEGAADNQIRFKMRLFGTPRESGVQKLPEWRDIEVEAKEMTIDQNVHAPARTSINLPPATSSQSRHLPAKLKKMVKFAASPQQPRSEDPLIIPSPSITQGRISDICKSVYHSDIARKNIGFIDDDEAPNCRHHLQFMNNTPASSVQVDTLHHLLKHSNKQPLGSSLGRGDRLSIAVTLASSVLQLDQTSWLKTQWRSCDISMHRTESLSLGPKSAEFHPYLSWDLVPNELSSKNNLAKSMIARHLIRSEALFALAITLIELCFGRTFADMQTLEDLDPNGDATLTNWKTARRLLDFVYRENGLRYGDVVRRCLDCPFDLRDLSLDNDDFLEAVLEYIVTPLSEDLEDFNGNRLAL